MAEAGEMGRWEMGDEELGNSGPFEG